MASHSKLRRRTLKYTGRAVLVAALLGLCWLGVYEGRRAWTLGSQDLLPLTTILQPKDFSVEIPASGELQSAESVAVAVPPVPVWRLRIASVVPDGRRVSKGDLLIEFDPEEIDLEVLEHRSNLEIANQKISKDELSVGVEKTDISKDKRLAELELEKINEFLPRDEQIYSRRAIIEAQLDKGYAEKKIVFADVRLELKGKVFSLDEAIMKLEREQAGAKLSQDQKALASLKLLAPAPGIVVYNERDFFFGGAGLMPGRYVYVGMTLFSLVNPEKMQAKCYVLEKDAGELKSGQPARLTLDPYPGMEFHGTVSSMDKLARPIERGSPVKYFQSILSLDRTDPALMKPGMKLKARIGTGNLKSVFVVPRSALVKKDAGFAAYILKGPGSFDVIPVTLGPGDLVQVVITDGVKAGQILALNPPDVHAPALALRSSKPSP